MIMDAKTYRALKEITDQLLRQLDTNGRYLERDKLTVFKAVRAAHELPRTRKKK